MRPIARAVPIGKDSSSPTKAISEVNSSPPQALVGTDGMKPRSPVQPATSTITIGRYSNQVMITVRLRIFGKLRPSPNPSAVMSPTTTQSMRLAGSSGRSASRKGPPRVIMVAIGFWRIQMPQESPARAPRIPTHIHIRHSWVTGYWPTIRMRRLAEITCHLASVNAHVNTPRARMNTK